MTLLPTLKDGDSSPRELGFLFHRRRRPGCPGSSYIASAGSHREPLGQDVLSGVDVPVVPGAAGRTLPDPCRKAERCEQVSATGADLGRRVPAIHARQLPSVTLALISQHDPESGPASGGDRASESSVADHPGHVKVLNGDHVELADQAGTGLMQEVAACILDSGVLAGHLHARFSVVPGGFLTAGKSALISFQPLFVAFPILWVPDLFSVGQNREMLESHVHAYALAASRQRDIIGHVCLEGYEPASRWIPRHGHRRGIQHGEVYLRPRPHESQWDGHLRKPKLRPAHAERGRSVRGGLPAGPGLEPRVTCALSEKRLECGVLMAKNLLEWDRRDLVKVCQFRIFLHECQCSIGFRVRDPLSIFLPAGAAGCQRLIPNYPHTPKRAQQNRLLRLVRICPTSECGSHSYIISTMTVKAPKARRTRCIPHPRAVASIRRSQ